MRDRIAPTQPIVPTAPPPPPPPPVNYEYPMSNLAVAPWTNEVP